MNEILIAKEVLELEADALLCASKKLDANFTNAVNDIYAISGKLIVMGIGKSGLVGAKIAATLASTGTASFFIHPTEAMHGDLGMISDNDAVLAISYSGESEELVAIVKHLKSKGMKIIAMSGFNSSSLAKLASTHLDIGVEKEACPLGAAPTTSTTVTIALGDALAVALMKKRGFKKEDFAFFHPGGSLGKKMFVKVCDLMKTQNLPIVSRETMLKDAIITMSDGKLGNLLFVEDGKLIAVLSDGDLRRALQSKDFSLEHTAIKYANLVPKVCANQNMLAVDALRFVEENKIQLLVVTDGNGTLEGVLHLHDLVSAGIK